MNRSKIIQAYEAHHARPAKSEAEELPTPPKYIFCNGDCDAVNAMSVFESECAGKARVTLYDLIDAQEIMFSVFKGTKILDATAERLAVEFKDGSRLNIDYKRGHLRVLRLA